MRWRAGVQACRRADVKIVFFTRAKFMTSLRSDTSQVSQDKSAKSSTAPSTPKNFSCCDTNEHANARPHEAAIIRDHRLCHAKNMLLLRTGGASLAPTAARSLMNVTASSLHLLPVSRATTTRRLLFPSTSSMYSARALVQTAPFTVAAFGHAWEGAVTAHRNVMSSANCAPRWRGIPDATTSMDRMSSARTATFISVSFALTCTVAPASLHTLARVRSGPSARDLNLPDRAHAARWRTTLASCVRDLHWQPKSFQKQGKVRNSSGATLNSGAVGTGPWARM